MPGWSAALSAEFGVNHNCDTLWFGQAWHR
jgi:hypothetical protein